MAFLINCPNCGERDVNEFRFGGEFSVRPKPGADSGQWASYLYSKKNAAGMQREWWIHRFGCRKWFLAERDTVTNRVEETFWA